MGNFLYHRIPEKMTGSILYPLNALKDLMPEIYNHSAQKYKGREFLFSHAIPTLNCLWNDVIFLSAVDPNEVNNAYASFGFKPMEHRYFKIDCNKLDHSLLATLIKPRRGLQPSKNFTPFDISQMKKYSRIPKRALEYYKQESAQNRHGRKVFVNAFIPHVFYKGSIDISDCEIVKLEPSPITI